MAMKIVAIATILVAGVEFHTLMTGEGGLDFLIRGGIIPGLAVFWAATHLVKN